MKILFSTVFLFSFIIGYSQINQNQIDFDEHFRLSDSIIKFKNLLACNSSLQISNLDEVIFCKSYRFMPAYNDSFSVGSVKFKNVFLFTDSTKKINTVSFFNSYIKTDSTDGELLASTIYNYLINFVSVYLQTSAKKYLPGYSKTKYSIQRSLCWRKDNNIYILTNNKFKRKKPGQKLTNVIMFSYSKEE
jgi:hypothetical protein